jgi:hypothetical protein
LFYQDESNFLKSSSPMIFISSPFSTSLDACCCRRLPCGPAPETNISVRFVTELEQIPPCDITSSFRASRGFHVVPVKATRTPIKELISVAPPPAYLAFAAGVSIDAFLARLDFPITCFLVKILGQWSLGNGWSQAVMMLASWFTDCWVNH